MSDESTILLSGESLPAIMARINAALPDDDPGKVTRAHVAALDTVAAVLPEGSEMSEAAREIREFLTALLPPE